jgi:hypothetical protein
MSKAILFGQNNPAIEDEAPTDFNFEDDRTHHRERARAELDLAYRAVSRAAAEAHLGLASLHMRRLSSLGPS